MDLSIQEEEIITILRRTVPYERVEIMKDDKGHLGMDYVVMLASRRRITTTGKKVPEQSKSKSINNE